MLVNSQQLFKIKVTSEQHFMASYSFYRRQCTLVESESALYVCFFYLHTETLFQSRGFSTHEVHDFVLIKEEDLFKLIFS